MADAQKTIELIFQGVDKTGAATQAALANAEKFSTSIRNVTQPIADFTLGALKLEAGLLAAGAAVVAFSVKTASDFDSAFRQISTIIDASAEDLSGFKQAILDYASGSTQPLEQITNALGGAIGSGIEWSQSLALIAQAEKLAVATRSDLDGTTKVLVSTLNSYGLAVDDVGKVSDLFFKIIDEGDISMTDLAGSFAKVAPIAKISGVSLEEVGAAIATLTASGIKPAESIEYLRGAISNIISPTNQARDLSAELGIEFNAAGLKANGLAGLLQQVAEKTGGSADKMKLLFGDIGGFTAAATLAGPQAEKFRDTLASMGNVAGATDEAFKKITSSLDVSGQKIASAFNALAVQIGTPLLDEFGGLAEAIAAVFQALGASVKEGSLSTLVEFVESKMNAIREIVEKVAQNLPAALAQADLSGFTRGIDAVAGAFSNLFDDIDLTTVDGLTKGIELAGAAFLGLSKFTAGVIKAFEPLFDLIVEMGSGVADNNVSWGELAGNLAGVATATNLLIPLLTVLSANQLVSFAGSLKTASDALAGSSGLLTLLGKAGLIGAAGAAGYAVGTALVDPINSLVSKLTGSKTTLGSWIYDLVNGSEEAERFGNAVDGAGKKVEVANNANGKNAEAIKKAADAAKAAINPFEEKNNILLAQSIAAEKAANGLTGLGASQGLVYENVKKIVPVFDAATGKLTGYKEELVRTLVGVDGLGDKSGKAADSVARIAKETKEAQEAQRKWGEELAKMDFQKSLKLIEQQTSVMVANIEAETKRATAAFESLNVGITSTGNVLSTLFKSYENYDQMNWGAISKIEKQMEAENAFREKQFSMQERLTEAQIRSMNAQADALIKGDGLIKVDGAGLKPHLEAFMWEILQTIQVRVNADGLKLLLGV